jgi:hypothetical protein
MGEMMCPWIYGKPKGRDHLGDNGIDGRIMLKQTIKETV